MDEIICISIFVNEFIQILNETNDETNKIKRFYITFLNFHIIS